MLEIHGFAIVSDDDRIADAAGQMPPALRNDADWAYFQAELDRSDLVAVGRLAHETSPNVKGRRRLVLSRASEGLERRGDAWWWNPERIGWSAVAAHLLPRGGRVAAPGGRAAFDVFLRVGYSAFHLTRVGGLRLPGGRPLFSASESGLVAERVLAQAGLRASETIDLDAAARVRLTIWRA